MSERRRSIKMPEGFSLKINKSTPYSRLARINQELVPEGPVVFFAKGNGKRTDARLFPDPQDRNSAFRRKDPGAFKEHLAEHKAWKLKLRAGVNRTVVCQGSFMHLRCAMVNQSSKVVITSLHCVLADDTMVVADESVFPLANAAWIGTLEYVVPSRISPGNHTLLVRLMRSDDDVALETRVDLRVYDRDELWRHNPVQVFNTPLDEVCRRDKAPVPRVISDITSVLATRCADVEGIFRKSADARKIAEIRERLDTGDSIDYDALCDDSPSGIHLVAGLLKLFIRLVPYPILGEHNYDALLALATHLQGKDHATKLATYRPITQDLPDHDREYLFTILSFFKNHVLSHADSNKMNAKNIAIVFGPVLLWKQGLDIRQEAANSTPVNTCIKDLLLLVDELRDSPSEEERLAVAASQLELADGKDESSETEDSDSLDGEWGGYARDEM